VTPRRLIEPARLAGSAVLRTQSDERLVDLVRDGNEGAFEAIVHRYRRQLLRYCGRFLTPSRAEDAVQQAFVNAYASLRSGDAEIQLRPWLYRIAHNASLNVLRQVTDYVQVDEQIDGVETPPQAVERGERFRSVVAAVQELPDRQRNALVLQALEGRSYEEIAAELGVSGGAVRQLLNRARTTLREGATALTPAALAARFGGALDAPVADRIAQVVAGTGSGAALAKGVAVFAVAGAVVGGTTERVVHTGGDQAGHHQSAPSVASSSPSSGLSHTIADHGGSAALLGSHRGGTASSGQKNTRHGSSGRGSHGGSGQGGGHTRDDSGHHSGSGGGGESHGGGGGSGGGGDGESHGGDSHSGPGGGGSGGGGGDDGGGDHSTAPSTDHSGDGGGGHDGSGSDNSGPSNDTTTVVNDSSGPGDGTDPVEDHSGSGKDGSSGSDDSSKSGPG
jgi:RNA polymerase sigma factor (sigma-70 family)